MNVVFCEKVVQSLYDQSIRGDKHAQYNLAVCFEHGIGTNRNYASAAYWFKSSADQGHPWAAHQVIQTQKKEFNMSLFENIKFVAGCFFVIFGTAFVFMMAIHIFSDERHHSQMFLERMQAHDRIAYRDN